MFISTQMFAYKLWSEPGYKYHVIFAEMMKLDPVVTWSDMRLSESVVSLEEESVELSFDFNFKVVSIRDDSTVFVAESEFARANDLTFRVGIFHILECDLPSCA